MPPYEVDPYWSTFRNWVSFTFLRDIDSQLRTQKFFLILYYLYSLPALWKVSLVEFSNKHFSTSLTDVNQHEFLNLSI